MQPATYRLRCTSCPCIDTKGQSLEAVPLVSVAAGRQWPANGRRSAASRKYSVSEQRFPPFFARGRGTIVTRVPELEQTVTAR